MFVAESLFRILGVRAGADCFRNFSSHVQGIDGFSFSDRCNDSSKLPIRCPVALIRYVSRQRRAPGCSTINFGLYDLCLALSSLRPLLRGAWAIQRRGGWRINGFQSSIFYFHSPPLLFPSSAIRQQHMNPSDILGIACAAVGVGPGGCISLLAYGHILAKYLADGDATAE